MTAATRSLLNTVRGAATELREQAAYMRDVGCYVNANFLTQLADDLMRDAAAVEAEQAIVIGTDDDDEPELGAGREVVRR